LATIDAIDQIATAGAAVRRRNALPANSLTCPLVKISIRSTQRHRPPQTQQGSSQAVGWMAAFQ
jgi:hypothetical protein